MGIEPTLSQTHHAFDFLSQKEPVTAKWIVLFGDEPFLKSRVAEKIKHAFLEGEDSDINLIRLEGKQTSLSEIQDELNTVSLFGGGQPRLVFVDNADTFVSENKVRLEEIANDIPFSGILVFNVSQWRSNSKLYKALDKKGLQIDCRPPQKGRGIDVKKIAKWAAAWGKKQHRLKIKAMTVEHMMELTGIELGIIDQNLAKLALYFDDKTEVSEEAVNEYIGGWQTKTIWQVIDYAMAGHTSAALSQLDRLFQNGEVPMSLFGQISWALRRYALAFDEAERYRRSGKRLDVDAVMANAGFRFPPEKKKVLEQLKKIGRPKGTQYYRLLLECDLALKASHSQPSRARLALEKLIFQLIDPPSTSTRAS